MLLFIQGGDDQGLILDYDKKVGCFMVGEGLAVRYLDPAWEIATIIWKRCSFYWDQQILQRVQVAMNLTFC